MLRRLCTALVAVAIATLLPLRAASDDINPLRPPEPLYSSHSIAPAAFHVQPPAELNIAPGDIAGPSAAPVEQTPPPALEPVPLNPPVVSMPQPGLMHKQEELLPPTPVELTWFHYFSRSWSSHRHPADPQRHFGIGEPLIDTSWRNRPLYVSLFAGGLMGDELQAGQVDQGGGFFSGLRFGGDFDHYWGLETRLAFSDLHVNYEGDVDSHKSSNSYFDASVLYYPLGDTRWRPYLTWGLGVAHYKYRDEATKDIRATAFVVPWGGGLKYLLTRNTAIRFDLVDNFSLKSGDKADTMHNFSFTGGVEIHFGGRQTSYGSW